MIQILASLRIFEWSMEIMLSVPSSTVRWKQIQCIQGGMMNFWNGFKGRQIDLADAEHTNQYHWAFVIKMYKTNYANNYKMRKKKKKTRFYRFCNAALRIPIHGLIFPQRVLNKIIIIDWHVEWFFFFLFHELSATKIIRFTNRWWICCSTVLWMVRWMAPTLLSICNFFFFFENSIVRRSVQRLQFKFESQNIFGDFHCLITISDS